MSEEKKETKETVVEEKPVEKDSDFADEEKPVPVPEEKKEEAKPAEEVKPVEPQVNLYKEEEVIEEPVQPATEVKEEPATEKPTEKGKDKKKEVITYVYGDASLAAIEEDRKTFFGQYKKSNIWKYAVSGICIALIIVGYILPTQIAAWKAYSMPITLSVLAVGVLGLGIFSFFSRKKIEAKMKDYFKKFYDNTNRYVMTDPDIKDINGSVDDKLAPEVFNDAGLYHNVVSVGSRASLNFVYKGLNCAIADAAGQTKGAKGALSTVFVGKFVQFPNNYEGGTCIVYLKGNKRALPPTALGDYKLIEDKRDMVVYGEEGAKRALTKKVRDAIAQIKTNETLCDVSIVIKSGKTYVALGYEDSLMVLPMEKPFNPAPTTQFKGDFAKILSLVDALNFKEKE
jgi:hypothetical protein